MRSLNKRKGPSLWSSSHGRVLLAACICRQSNTAKNVRPKWLRGHVARHEANPYVYRLGLRGWLSYNQRKLASFSSSCTAILSTFFISFSPGGGIDYLLLDCRLLWASLRELSLVSLCRIGAVYSQPKTTKQSTRAYLWLQEPCK